MIRNCKTAEEALRVLQCLSKLNEGSGESVWWRTDGEYAPVTFFINCNDFFWWGTGDAEELSVEDLAVFEQAHLDCMKADTEPKQYLECYAPLLYCARRRGMRPQGAYYKHLPERLHALFDACGPEREVNIANPTGRNA